MFSLYTIYFMLRFTGFNTIISLFPYRIKITKEFNYSFDILF